MSGGMHSVGAVRWTEEVVPGFQQFSITFRFGPWCLTINFGSVRVGTAGEGSNR